MRGGFETAADRIIIIRNVCQDSGGFIARSGQALIFIRSFDFNKRQAKYK